MDSKKCDGFRVKFALTDQGKKLICFVRANSNKSRKESISFFVSRTGSIGGDVDNL